MQTHEQICAAIESLLPLLEQELDGPDPAREWTPPASCAGRSCWDCREKCKDIPLFAIWRQLRAAYPQLHALESLLNALMYEHANWASALYWVYIQPWDGFEQKRRQEYAREGIEWLATQWAERRLGWIPTVEWGLPERHGRDTQIAGMLKQGFPWARICQEVGCSRRDVAAISRAIGVRPRRPKKSACSG